ncbi:MAG: leucine-rich repeat domain-containing protein, partial [Bacilli bacterium]|nr:leucine-rich repeat domain-containing protein [Bacilli bacterium]
SINYEQVSGSDVTVPAPEQSDLFTWDGPGIVSGLSEKGIAEVKANGGHLVIPEGVTEIASANFDFVNSSGSFDKGFSPFAIGKIEMSDPDFESKILQAEVNIIKRITFPSTLKKIGAGAFSFCLYLEEDLLLPTGLIEIGAGSFAMVSMNSLVIPDTVTVIGAFSFQSSSVSSLKLGSSVMTVEKYAFSECNNLQGELVIPNSVKTIGEMGFGVIIDSYNKINSISISKNTIFVNNGSDQDSFYNRPTLTIRD